MKNDNKLIYTTFTGNINRNIQEIILIIKKIINCIK
jgi:hypothetical protein